MSRSIRARARTAGLILVAAGVAALTAPFAAPSAASADVLGGLTFTPASGSDLEAPVVTTSAGCPLPADGYNAFLTGPVFKDPFLIAFTQDVNFSNTTGFPVQLSDSFKDAATEAGVVLIAGDYAVTVQCVETFSQEVKGTFTAIVRFTSPTAWVTGVGPSTSSSVTPSPSSSVSPPVSVSPSVSPSATSASPSASGTPSASAPPSPSASADPTADPTTDPATGPSSSPPATPTGGSLPLTGPPALPIALIGALLLTAGIVLVCSVDPVRP